MAPPDGTAIEPGVAPAEPPSSTAHASVGLADRRVAAAFAAIVDGERRPDVLRGLLDGVLRAYAERWPAGAKGGGQ